MAQLILKIPDNILQEVLTAFAENKPDGITPAVHAKRQIREFVINKVRNKRLKESINSVEAAVQTDTQNLNVD